MKKRLQSFAIITLSLFTFSAASFGQIAPGGSGSGTPPPVDGGGTTVASQPLPTSFTRNNGDGTCGMEAQIRLYYTTAPTASPVLQNIWYNGAPLYSNFQPVTGNIADYATKGYVSFCLPTSNIPPAIKLILDIIPSSVQSVYSISGTN